MVTKEKLLELVSRAYGTAKEHGFHDVERSNAHFMMLVLSEIGEMVEADRKNRRADMNRYDVLMQGDRPFTFAFIESIKDTMEDELADVVIRLLDFTGKRGIDLGVCEDGIVDMQDTFVDTFGKMSVCEQSFYLSRCIATIDDNVTEKDLPILVGSALAFCNEFATFHGIDLWRHVEMKMRYNETRQRMHGKNYYNCDDYGEQRN